MGQVTGFKMGQLIFKMGCLAHFKTGQTEFIIHYIGLASFKMGWPILEQVASFRMGQILYQDIT